MTVVQAIPYAPTWPEPDARLLRPERPPAPPLPLNDILSPSLAEWVAATAEAKGAPPDYVLAALLSVASACIGNARWVSPWPGWVEPPALWCMCIGIPSSGKSPAMDSVLQPLRAVERPMREQAQAKRAEWSEAAEIAKIAEATWKETAKAATKAGDDPPSRPATCDAGAPPPLPRLIVNDATVERLAMLLADRPRGVLQMRDELSGWLQNMTRYSNGGNDRPFWLEAYGGRSYTIERVGRDPLTIERLTVPTLGGIQPDRLKSLLFKADDDGLLARFLPIWPDPAPVRRPRKVADDALLQRVLERLLELEMISDEQADERPAVVHFTEEARSLMDVFRQTIRDWEVGVEGLLLSFIGKLPGVGVGHGCVGHLRGVISFEGGSNVESPSIR